jgi:hypothetical protein
MISPGSSVNRSIPSVMLLSTSPTGISVLPYLDASNKLVDQVVDQVIDSPWSSVTGTISCAVFITLLLSTAWIS